MTSIRSMLAAATCVVVSFMPTGSPAAASFVNPQCSGAALVGRGPATCVATFEIAEPVRPSLIGTHANFHVPVAMGTITMQWIDDHYGTVATWSCNAVGAYFTVRTQSGQGTEFGPFDAAPVPNCTEKVYDAAAYATGSQLLIVEATAVSCTTDRPQSSCPFHGALQLQPSVVPL